MYTIATLLATKDEVIVYFTRRDLLGEAVEPIQLVYELQKLQKILQRQDDGGCAVIEVFNDSSKIGWEMVSGSVRMVTGKVSTIIAVLLNAPGSV